ncbi:hypothetical protein [Halapricum desulfuricans]|uniref:hypothetical protein n=1 Tax=Halapricum desulfuricans TaxID=2841257 RepID=UPI001E657446|nr:hypothetical protein [Halapricum desulfuricans]
MAEVLRSKMNTLVVWTVLTNLTESASGDDPKQPNDPIAVLGEQVIVGVTEGIGID